MEGGLRSNFELYAQSVVKQIRGGLAALVKESTMFVFDLDGTLFASRELALASVELSYSMRPHKTEILPGDEVIEAYGEVVCADELPGNCYRFTLQKKVVFERVEHL